MDYSLKLTWRKYMLILLGFRTSWVNSVIDMIFSSWFTGSRCFHIYRHPPIFDGRKHIKICKHHVKKENTMSSLDSIHPHPWFSGRLLRQHLESKKRYYFDFMGWSNVVALSAISGRCVSVGGDTVGCGKHMGSPGCHKLHHKLLPFGDGVFTCFYRPCMVTLGI